MANYASFSFILIIFLLLFYVVAQNNGTVAVGSTLTANPTSRPWLSPSKDFAFGFRKNQDNDLFLLAIWYWKIPIETIVWFNNTTGPVPQGSTVALDRSSGLVLRNPQGELVWTTKDAAVGYVDHGFMNDTGNFILMGNDNLKLWESFKFPADTLLPFQNLLPGSELISRGSETNFSEGRFHLRFLDDGDLVLATRNVPTNREDDHQYYHSQTSDNVNNGSASGVQVVFEESGSLQILKRNNETTEIHQSSLPPASENYFRATLNFDGVFTLYYHPRTFSGMPNWTAVWWLPHDICYDISNERGGGPCGYNNICTLGDFGRPICECPQGYQLVDPNDRYGRCIGNFTESCDDVEQASIQYLYGFIELSDTNFVYADVERSWTSNATECKQKCLEDCFCAAAVFGEYCWKKRLPLSNGRRSTVQEVTFLKYKKSVPKKGMSIALKLATEISAAGIGTIIFLLILFCKFKKSSSRIILLLSKRRRNDGRNLDALIKKFEFLAPKRYRYSAIKKITNSFKHKLGSGGYGDVYKGNLFDGSPVAVKILNASKGDGEDFVNEVASISRTSHVNIVTFLGFCLEGQKRAIIYEFVPNGSLEKFIYSKDMQNNNCYLGWEKLYQIALGVARGLEYLHRGCSTRILHFDIKPHNILLDEDFLPKISDFGLSKQCTGKESIISMLGARGTIGYIAPEVVSRHFGQVSHKSDVYSYGMMVLEMVGGRKNISVDVSHTSEIYFPHWVYHHLVMGEDLKLQGIQSQESNEIARKMIIVGLWCIQTDPLHRPSMAKVIEMLEGNLQALEIPPKPIFGSLESSTEDCSTTIDVF